MESEIRKAIIEYHLKEALLKNGLTWNSWQRYPHSIFADKKGKHFDIVSYEKNTIQFHTNTHLNG